MRQAMVATVPLKGIKKYKSKGDWYYYHRKTATRIVAPYGSAEFIDEVKALDALVLKKAAKPGTLLAVIRRYKASKFWTELAGPTKISYERALARLAPIEAMPLRKINQEFVAGLRDKIAAKHGRWMANYVLTVLSLLFDTALENGWAPANPTKGVRRIRKSKKSRKVNRPWQWQECRTVLDAAPAYLKVPIALAMLAGFRKSDVLSITKDRIRDGLVYHHSTSKTGSEVRFPAHPTLANVLALAPAHDGPTIAVNSRGKKWTESGFNSTFSKLIRGLERAGAVEPGLTMHGLRHTLGTRLAEGGADLDTIRKVLGQKTLAMAQLYSETADRSEQAQVAFDNLHILEARSGTRAERELSNSLSNGKAKGLLNA